MVDAILCMSLLQLVIMNRKRRKCFALLPLDEYNTIT